MEDDNNNVFSSYRYKKSGNLEKPIGKFEKIKKLSRDNLFFRFIYFLVWILVVLLMVFLLKALYEFIMILPELIFFLASYISFLSV
ncbi:hypothetical protein HCQ94_05325 [Actinomyces sp. zg-332]|uniref:hypothetical protein n=1 Tax=Actinomyces sp. zg-332 TaxID=2708340 RepID=UPI0014247780|nr:hypothetical protein [Actinomyces sp. zg-332]QPK93991.1 hypothetical protein HCQ94_05325 [Actinomyces sp. zg-332]